MERVLSPYRPQIYAVFRMVFGFLFLQHGAQKLFGVLGGFGGEPGSTAPLLSIMGLAGIIEFFGGLMILAGLMSSLTAFICSGQMAVAYFWRHQPNGALPLLNRGEPAVLFCFAFLFIAAYGAGIWSIDAARRKGS
jgi:putative oxidoreductase